MKHLALLLLFASCTRHIGGAKVTDAGRDENPAATDGSLAVADGTVVENVDAAVPPTVDATVVPDAVGSCSQNSECSGSLPICDMNACRACAMSSDCAFDVAHPVCAQSGNLAGACVECTTSSDCQSKQMACDVAHNVCAACEKNEECSTGLCSAAICALAATQVYVDGSAHCIGADGSYDKPFCTISEGLNQAMIPGSPHVVVVRSGSYSDILTVTSGAVAQLTLIGLSQPTLTANGVSPAVTVQSSGPALDLTIDNFVLTGARGHTLACSGYADAPGKTKLTLQRSTVQNGAKIGINSSNCTLRLDRDVIKNNGGGGIYLSTTDFTLTNLLVVGNGTTTTSFGGITVPLQATTSLIFNLTIVNNSARNSAYGGITSSEALAATGIVLFGNGGMAEHDNNFSPFACAFVGANSGSSIDLAGCHQGQIFKDSQFHLQTGAGACVLVDKGHAPMSPPAQLSFDLDGNPRPVGAYDIGAYESQ